MKKLPFEISSLLSKYRDYSLDPNADFSDPNLDPRKAQTVFILKNAKEFFGFVERRLLKKLLSDIAFILKKGWIRRIPEDEKSHVHICGTHPPPLFDFKFMFHSNNIHLLYHFLENPPHITQEHLNRNLYSSLTFQPTVVRIPRKMRRDLRYYTVRSDHLGLEEYGAVCFWESSDGPYTTLNGRKMFLKGRLYKEGALPYLRRNCRAHSYPTTGNTPQSKKGGVCGGNRHLSLLEAKKTSYSSKRPIRFICVFRKTLPTNANHVFKARPEVIFSFHPRRR